METIGSRLKQYSKIRCGSVKQLAEELGMRPDNLQKYASDRHEPGAKLLQALARHGCNVHWLICGDGPMIAGSSEDVRIDEEGQAMISVLMEAGINDAEILRDVLMELRNFMNAHEGLMKSFGKNLRRVR